MVQKHPFHLVDPSPWPLLTSTRALVLTRGSVGYFHGYSGGGMLRVLGLVMLLMSLYVWFRDIVREGRLEGQHRSLVQLGLRVGMVLFIVSEVMFFVGFFWAFFWSSLSPVPEIGSVWPPKGIEVLRTWEVPFLNTVLLLSSGASVTWAHHRLVGGNRGEALVGLIVTVMLAVVFTACQVFEYQRAGFRISDGVYGSTFYMATGFHGFHVVIGTCFLMVCMLRLGGYQLTREHHFGFEAAAWYWHFVDVVWLFLFVTMYWWSR